MAGAVHAWELFAEQFSSKPQNPSWVTRIGFLYVVQ